ncbi:MAG: ABC transporter ATP-binding protein [Erysipelotrichaceae bacterium]
MIKLFKKYLKPHWFSLIVIIVLLFAKANLDLMLPDYMSDIVNNGIQLSGITETIPQEISQTSYNKITNFLTNEEKEVLEKSYKLEENSYHLVSDEQSISDVISNPLILMFAIDNNLLPIETPEMMDVYQMFGYLEDNDKTAYLDTIYQQLASSVSDSNKTQLMSVIIKAEYEMIGLDTAEMQNTYILTSGLIMLFVAALSVLVAILNGFVSSKMGAKVEKELRKDVFSKVSSFSNSEYDKFSPASLITRTTNDITQIKTIIVMMCRMFLYAPILGIGALIKVINANAGMLWVIGLGLLIVLILLMLMLFIALPKIRILQQLIDKLNLVTRESLTGMMVVRAFSNEQVEEDKFDHANSALAKVQLFVNRSMAFMMPSVTFIMNAIGILVVWVGGKEIVVGNMLIGDMMAYIQYTSLIFMSFIILAIIFVILPRAMVSATRINEVLDTPLTIIDPTNTKEFIEDATGEVVFDNVTFAYPNADEPAIDKISFKAQAGKMTAIIGSTGSGKSTLIRLIPRFYDVCSGSIRVNGVDVREVEQKKLRNKIGFIPQKAVLFSGTIESNLKYGNEQAGQNDLEKAIEIAQATEIVNEKTDKYQSHIAQGGTNLSGGQKQRMSIARALVKNPDIYIFDDSFSALDYKTDANLRKALKEQLGDKTLIVVAQRISTIKDAEKIIVMENGKIVGSGSHDELMSNCKVYQEIAYSQLDKEEL